MFFKLHRTLIRRIVFAALLLGLLGFVGIRLYQKMFPKIVFISRFPEMWYPRDPQGLKKTIMSLFLRAQEKYVPLNNPARPWMICVPHAGYAYSGEVAAAGYHYWLGGAAKDISRVIILSPSHYIDFYGLAIPDFTHYQTPLGEIAVDVGVVKKLSCADLVEMNETVFHREHAIDVQIPWIQTCMPQAKIVPLIVGRLAGDDMVQHLGQLIASHVDAATVIVVSSDFVHYGKRFEYCPFGTTKKAASDVDAVEQMIVSECLRADRYALEYVFDDTKAAVCGKNVLRVAFEVAVRAIAEQSGNLVSLQESSQGFCVAHDNSFAIRERLGEKFSEYERVGYAALVYSVK